MGTMPRRRFEKPMQPPEAVSTRGRNSRSRTLLAHDFNGTKLTSLVLRPFTVFGKESLPPDRGHLFGRWLTLGKQGRKLTVYGDGSQVIDPVPVESVASACKAWLSMNSLKGITTVNVTSGHPLTLQRLAELFVEAGLAPGIERMPAMVGDTSRGWGDPAAFEQLVGQRITALPEETVYDFLRSLHSHTEDAT